MKTIRAVWSQVSAGVAQGPGPRSSHSLNFCNNQLFVYGGERKAREALNNDLYIFSLSEKTWKSTPSALPPRLGHAAVVVGTTLFFHGGRTTDKKELEDLWSFETQTQNWTQVRKIKSILFLFL